jgi:hypothetical protein
VSRPGRLAGSRANWPSGKLIQPPDAWSDLVVGELTGRRQVKANTSPAEALGDGPVETAADGLGDGGVEMVADGLTEGTGPEAAADGVCPALAPPAPVPQPQITSSARRPEICVFLIERPNRLTLDRLVRLFSSVSVVSGVPGVGSWRRRFINGFQHSSSGFVASPTQPNPFLSAGVRPSYPYAIRARMPCPAACDRLDVLGGVVDVSSAPGTGA